MNQQRRVTDKQPQRETYLQELVNRQNEELLLIRAENARLRKEVSQIKREYSHEKVITSNPFSLGSSH